MTVAFIIAKQVISHALKEDVMKKFLLSIMVLATLSSCGKDNKVSSGAAAAPPVINGYSNGHLTGPSLVAAQDLIAKINNPATFGGGLVITSYGSSNQNCGTKWGFINYCYGSSGGGNYAITSGMTWNELAAQKPNLSYYYYYGSQTVHSSVNIATKQAELIQLLNTATALEVSGTLYYIRVTNAIYVIDTRYPIQANPSALKVSQGEDYLYGAY